MFVFLLRVVSILLIILLSSEFSLSSELVNNTEIEHKFEDEIESAESLENIYYSNSEELNLTRRLDPQAFENDVIFHYYKDGVLKFISTAADSESITETGCSPTDKFAFLIHGWKESCGVPWMGLLIEKLTNYRGGCIICIDISAFTSEPYTRLLRQFPTLTDVITVKLKDLESQGFDPSLGYMFGFSYGGQLVCAIGQNFRKRRFKEIDTCDMAGPGFDIRAAFVEHRDAAENVQCIHTSREFGTRLYNCHQNWRMGNCGHTQIAASSPPMGSHGLCPHFYASAFEHNFYAIEPPYKCKTRNPATSWPQNFKMGYMEKRKTQVNGELFALTGEKFPYAVFPVRTYDDLLYSSPSQDDGNHEFTVIKKTPSILNSIKKARKLLRRGRRRFQNPL